MFIWLCEMFRIPLTPAQIDRKVAKNLAIREREKKAKRKRDIRSYRDSINYLLYRESLDGGEVVILTSEIEAHAWSVHPRDNAALHEALNSFRYHGWSYLRTIDTVTFTRGDNARSST